MNKKLDTNNIELQMASSIMYYDKKEMQQLFEIYDSMQLDSHIYIDGSFNSMITYLHSFNKYDKDPVKRKNNIISYLKICNSSNPDSDARAEFSVWLDMAASMDVPMELSEDIKYHFLWNSYYNAVNKINSNNLPFKDKLSVRPSFISDKVNNSLIVSLDDIEYKGVAQTKYTTGINILDSTVHLTDTNFEVICARPGVGKSLFMLRQAISNARQGKKVIFASLEMSAVSINKRIVNIYSKRNIEEEFRDENGIIDEKKCAAEYEKIKKQKGFKAISDNFSLFVSPSKNADTILSKMEEQIKANDYDIIFIDYLQLLRYPGKDEWGSLRALTSDLKSLAFRNNILVVSATQVSRSTTEMGITLADLFGSSTIENDADVIIALENFRDRIQGQKAIINIKTLKNREGDLSDDKFSIDYAIGDISEIIED